MMPSVLFLFLLRVMTSLDSWGISSGVSTNTNVGIVNAFHLVLSSVKTRYKFQQRIKHASSLSLDRTSKARSRLYGDDLDLGSRRAFTSTKCNLTSTDYPGDCGINGGTDTISLTNLNANRMDIGNTQDPIAAMTSSFSSSTITNVEKIVSENRNTAAEYNSDTPTTATKINTAMETTSSNLVSATSSLKAYVKDKNSVIGFISDSNDIDNSNKTKIYDNIDYGKIRKTWPLGLQYFIRDSGLFRTLSDTVLVPFTIWPIVQQYPTSIQDYLKLSGIPLIMPPMPTTDWNGNSATKQNSDNYDIIKFDTISYGPNPYQIIHTMQKTKIGDSANKKWSRTYQASIKTTVTCNSNDSSTKLIVFVHGGAWGSGFPALYRSIATPFLLDNDDSISSNSFDKKKVVVAVVGYRTYPTTDVNGQVDDVVTAIQYLFHKYTNNLVNSNNRKRTDKYEFLVPSIRMQQKQQPPVQPQQRQPSITLISHSSGAHICSLALVQGRFTMVKKHTDSKIVQDSSVSSSWLYTHNIINRFIGMAGVYDIPEHYRYEKSRGVERFSLLAAAFNTTSLMNWKRLSPTRIVRANSPFILTAADAFASNNNVTEESKRIHQSICLGSRLPRQMLLLHGDKDTTVPSSSTVQFYNTIRQQIMNDNDKLDEEHHSFCARTNNDNFTFTKNHSSNITLAILKEVGHSEMVVQLMFGGSTRDAILKWIHDSENK